MPHSAIDSRAHRANQPCVTARAPTSNPKLAHLRVCPPSRPRSHWPSPELTPMNGLPRIQTVQIIIGVSKAGRQIIHTIPRGGHGVGLWRGRGPGRERRRHEERGCRRLLRSTAAVLAVLLRRRRPIRRQGGGVGRGRRQGGGGGRG